jgi:hypothetical protein
LIAVVVLPTPPFWFAMAMTLAKRVSSSAKGAGVGDDVIANLTRKVGRHDRVIHRMAKLFTESVDISPC